MDISYDNASLMAVIFLGVMTFPILIYIGMAVKGRELHIRKIPGMGAIDEAVGRATEMGRPICFTSGLGSVDPVTLAAIGILGHISRLSARYDNKVFVPMRDPVLIGIATEVCKEAHRKEGKAELFSADDVMFLGGDQFAYASGIMGMIQRKKVAAHFLFGIFAAEALILAEAGQHVGAIQVAGTTSTTQIPFFITTCDYTIIGEELYAASAYLTKQPVLLGSLYGQDRVKMILLVVIVFGVIVATATGATDPKISWFSLFLISK